MVAVTYPTLVSLCHSFVALKKSSSDNEASGSKHDGGKHLDVGASTSGARFKGCSRGASGIALFGCSGTHIFIRGGSTSRGQDRASAHDGAGNGENAACHKGRISGFVMSRDDSDGWLAFRNGNSSLGRLRRSRSVLSSSVARNEDISGHGRDRSVDLGLVGGSCSDCRFRRGSSAAGEHGNLALGVVEDGAIVHRVNKHA